MYAKFLSECSEISIKNAKIFSTNVHYHYSFQEITSLLSREMSNPNNHQQSGESVEKSLLSTDHSMYSGRHNQKAVKN